MWTNHCFSLVLCVGGEGGDKNLTTNCLVASGKDSSLHKSVTAVQPSRVPTYCFM